MIPFDFEYYRPDSLDGAIELFHSLDDKKTEIFCGGTEFITFARNNQLTADAVIDIKCIPECRVLNNGSDQVTLGTALTLNEIIESEAFPLLGETIRRIADHTSRNKITIGGHLNSRLIYREGILPLLLSDAVLKVAGKNGVRIIPLNGFKPKSDDILLQIIVDKKYAGLPFAHYKKTRFSKVGYPLVTIAAIKEGNKICAAISGVCTTPFRSKEVETILNDSSLPSTNRIEKALEHLPAPIIEDFQGSADYRKFILKNGLLKVLNDLEASK
ncbi:xanthine dehydrogenase FAD-binding subunit [Bacillus freudenreichii]|nr:xanthine dehydrogenase FAD-binding subunit [Bacillus freudenreichii]